MSSGRHQCRCTRCSCSSTAYHAGDPCPSCRADAHRPSTQIQEHLQRGLEEWIRLLPYTAGSSGLSDRQLRQTGEAWEAWHAREACPVRAAA